MSNWTELPRDAVASQLGEAKGKTVTPYFRFESVFNEPQAKLQGKPVHDLLEVVEIRFAGNPNYKPVFLVTEMCEADEKTGQIVTWAERYAPQYRAFLAGGEQQAEGTPLEELLPYGISQAQLSLCRALNIYSIEALAHIEGPGVKKLGVHGNSIKPMAQRFLEDKRAGNAQQGEIEALRAELEQLRAAQALSTVLPVEVPSVPDEVQEAMSDDAMRDEIEQLTGARPHHRTGRTTLIDMLKQAREA